MSASQETIEGYSGPPSLLTEGFDHYYIHEGALALHAITSEKIAANVFMFMGSLKLQRVVGNMLDPGGDADHEWAWEEDEGAVETVKKTLAGADEPRFINPFLREVGVTVISMDERGDPIKKLAAIGGRIMGSCFEQDYYTYGVDKKGTKKMRDEAGSIPRSAEEMGPGLGIVHGPNGPVIRGGRGLIDINAAALASGRKVLDDYLFAVEIGIGVGGSEGYVREKHPSSQLSLEQVLGLDKAMRDGIKQTASVRIGMVMDTLDRQRNGAGQERYKARAAHIQNLNSVVMHAMGHRLIRERFYPQTG